MARSDQQTLRTHGRKLAIEIIFDDEPGTVIAREVALAPDKAATGLSELIAEQLANGFVAQPSWMPTPEWIRSASAEDIALEVADVWLVAAHRDPTLWARMPPSVRSFLALDTMLAQSRRNGLSSFIVEDDPQYLAHIATAARETGLSEIEQLFERATAGMDLGVLARRGVGVRVRFGSASAAKALERLASTLEPDRRLTEWIREHAEDFCTIDALRGA